MLVPALPPSSLLQGREGRPPDQAQRLCAVEDRGWAARRSHRVTVSQEHPFGVLRKRKWALRWWVEKRGALAGWPRVRFSPSVRGALERLAGDRVRCGLPQRVELRIHLIRWPFQLATQNDQI